MEQLRTIIRELKNILSQEGLTGLEQKDILEMSVKIYLTDRINKLGISNYQKDKKVDSGQDMKGIEPATPKQQAFLEKVGKYKEGMTKQEAFSIIAELSKKKKEQNY